MSMQTTPPPAQSQSVRMEINGRPYYIQSKGTVPYLYDIDTNDEVGYWSSKKGCYVMFSLYNRMMKQKYDNVFSTNESDSSSNSTSEEVKSNSSLQDNEDHEDEEDEDEEEDDWEDLDDEEDEDEEDDEEWE